VTPFVLVAGVVVALALGLRDVACLLVVVVVLAIQSAVRKHRGGDA